jgi:hypothetical protein
VITQRLFFRSLPSTATFSLRPKKDQLRKHYRSF